jgi:methyltransferase (TIGR00027 family)
MSGVEDTDPAVVSSTAYWIAAVRARETERADRIFVDPYAKALAGRRGLEIMRRSEAVGGRRNEFIPVRVRWFDDRVQAAVAGGCGQVVVLGAGLDTRAWRLALPAGLAWFDIDHTAFADKEALGAVRCRRRFVAADLTGDWAPALLAAGFSAAVPAVWLAEGLFYYLAADTATALLATAATLSAPGSVLLADIMPPSRRPRRVPGVPAPFGTGDPAALLASGGWTTVSASAPGAPDANFGRFPPRPTGVLAGAPHLIHAVV